MEQVSNTLTGVYTGSFSYEYMVQMTRDPECPSMYAAQAYGLSMLANRLSWFFNLQGPSLAVDTACSSSAMAIDLACQGLLNGSCDMVGVLPSKLSSV